MRLRVQALKAWAVKHQRPVRSHRQQMPAKRAHWKRQEPQPHEAEPWVPLTPRLGAPGSLRAAQEQQGVH